MLSTNKVFAYITHGDQILVFRHVDFPEAGIQIPGGTIEEGEEPEEAVLREAYEETGLVELHLACHLGSDDWIILNNRCSVELRLRHFYHLICKPCVPDSWQHDELHPSDGSPAPITSEFFWLPVTEATAALEPYYIANIDKLSGSLPRFILG